MSGRHKDSAINRHSRVAAVLAFVLSPFAASLADAVLPADAELAATAWAVRGGTYALGVKPARTTRHDAINGVSYYAVQMSRGGTVITSGDSESEPIIAFTSSDEDISDLDPDSPLKALLERDAMVRAMARADVRAKASKKWADLKTEGEFIDALSQMNIAMPLFATVSPIMSASSIGDVRVPALVKSKWGQSGPGSMKAFNLYTPKNYVSGCVATAMSQVMRYHQWPRTAMTPVTHKCFVDASYSNGVKYGATNLTTQAGTYDWANMPLSPSSSTITSNQCHAIGQLLSDAGISVYMHYTSSGSGSFDMNVVSALKGQFGFGNATYYSPSWASGDAVTAEGVLSNTILCNLDAGFPVILGVSGNGGHCIVADGYGYNNGIAYVHLNMGWHGSYDYWYNLPSIATGSVNSYSSVDDVVYNIFPNKSSSNGIISGRVTNSDGVAVSGAKVEIISPSSGSVVSSSLTSSSGVYGLVVAAGSYGVRSISSDNTITSAVTYVTLTAPQTASSNAGGYIVNGYWLEQYSVTYVRSTAGIGNSWGNDLVLPESGKEYVAVTVSVDAPSGVKINEDDFAPAPGTYSYEKGSAITLFAPECLYVTNYSGNALSLHRATSATNICLIANENTNIVWSYNQSADYYAVRRITQINNLGSVSYNGSTVRLYAFFDGTYASNTRKDADLRWTAAGSSVTVQFPEHLLDGECFSEDHLNCIISGSLVEVPSNIVFRLGGVAVTDYGASSYSYLNNSGAAYPANCAMANSYTFTVNCAKAVMGLYWDESQRKNDLPYWWYMRYLSFGGSSSSFTTGSGDPDGDGFTNAMELEKGVNPVDSKSFPFEITSFSLDDLQFIGSIKGSIALMRTDSLSAPNWQQIWSNSSTRQSVSNTVDISSLVNGANGFFRLEYTP